MKKLLLTLSSISIGATSMMSLVSCGVKPEKEVIFAIIGGATQVDSDLEKVAAYKESADEYNKKHKDVRNFAPIKVVWRDSKYLSNSILAGDNLPDLYISYPDAASTYVSTKVGDQVRDMAESMGEGFEDFQNDLITDAFIKEGQYSYTENGELKVKQIILPFGKSFDISVINVRLFLEFMSIVESYEEEAKKLKSKFEEYNETRKQVLDYTNLSGTKVFSDKAKISSSTLGEEEFEQLKIILNNCLKEAEISQNYDQNYVKNHNVTNAIKNVFASTDNVLLITKYMNQIIKDKEQLIKVSAQAVSAIKKDGNVATFDELKKINEDNKNINLNAKYNYAFGMDSIDNKFYSDYISSDDVGEVIDVQDSNNKFWYNTTYNKDTKIANIEFDSDSESFKATTKFLDGMKTIAKSNFEHHSPGMSQDQQWNGVFSFSRIENNQKTYVTQDFMKGTMFVASASSANDSYFSQETIKNEIIGAKTANYLFVSKSDIITSSNVREEPSKDVFVSQGRGVAGFKSNGTNAIEKEKSVTGYLNYMMEAEQTSRFALRTSYLPATKSGLEIYKNYVNGNYDNSQSINGNPIRNLDELKKATANVLKIEDITQIDENLVKSVFKPILTNKGNIETKANPSPVSTSLVEDYLLPKVNNTQDNIRFVSSNPIPTTDIIRSSLKNATLGTNAMLDLSNADSWNAKFEEMLTVDKTKYYSIQRWINTNKGDFFKEINISQKAK